ncbi:hypothetical protein DICSQDRAFT_172760 [Dichomitus squalens LYAD-421 SS1]|uniref:Uncharacterized protein n=1 Tax=Dichomitus squalens (strain LYAD-421) TaxID=732165 RepID=R7SUW0_DICSQ|nr:uncharacterized protein DICSQDRAFT_172760 [Dichomitus squalens LYAD-421 SS1]EJF58747.1 hypothetical protein DICSQDRAFT_172760 [Dichomitus squalens LYAD-421 SS1]
MAFPLPAILAGLSTLPPKKSAARSATALHLRDTHLTIAHACLVHVEHITISLALALALAVTLPERKGSVKSEYCDSKHDKGPAGSGASRQSLFPFGGNPKTWPGSLGVFNDGAQLGQGPSSPALLSPPTVVGPADEDEPKVLVADGAALRTISLKLRHWLDTGNS